MGLLAFTEFCIATRWHKVDNPYTIHEATRESLTALVYCEEFWYDVVTAGWEAAQVCRMRTDD